jgi:hypothetical protein
MKTYGLLILFILVLSSVVVFAQHEHHQMKRDTTKKEMKHDGKQGNKKTMKDVDHNSINHQMETDSSMVPMTHSYSLNLPMNRNGSGTGWLPDASPMYGYMVHTKKWMYMFHGNIVLRYMRTSKNRLKSWRWKVHSKNSAYSKSTQSRLV